MADENQTRNNATSLVGHIIGKGIALLVLAAVVAGAYFYLHYTTGLPTANGPEHRSAGKPPTVSVIDVQPQTIELSPQYLGQTAAYRTVEIRTRVAGFLRRYKVGKNGKTLSDQPLFKEGGKVHNGQLLFTIAPEQFEANLRSATAQLDSDKAHLKRATQQQGRYQKLVDEGAATASELENWQTQVDVAKADIQHDKAMIKQAQLNIDYTHITSPMDGVIGKTHQNEGAYVSPTGTSLLAVVRKIDPIYVNDSVSDAELLRWQAMIEAGRLKLPADGKLRVKLKLADGSTYTTAGKDPKPILGKVDYTSVTVDPSTGTAQIRAVVPNPHGVLRPGEYVNVTVVGARQTNAILVPKRAVEETPGSASIMIVGKGDIVRPQPVTLGRFHKSSWIISSGLKPGQLVLVDHLNSVYPGTKVNPQTETYAAAIQPLTLAAKTPKTGKPAAKAQTTAKTQPAKDKPHA